LHPNNDLHVVKRPNQFLDHHLLIRAAPNLRADTPNHQAISTGDTRSSGFPSPSSTCMLVSLNNASACVVPHKQSPEDCAQRPRCRHKSLSIARFTGCVVEGVLK
jgi:hypothetical protein